MDSNKIKKSSSSWNKASQVVASARRMGKQKNARPKDALDTSQTPDGCQSVADTQKVKVPPPLSKNKASTTRSEMPPQEESMLLQEELLEVLRQKEHSNLASKALLARHSELAYFWNFDDWTKLLQEGNMACHKRLLLSEAQRSLVATTGAALLGAALEPYRQALGLNDLSGLGNAIDLGCYMVTVHQGRDRQDFEPLTRAVLQIALSKDLIAAIDDARKRQALFDAYRAPGKGEGPSLFDSFTAPVPDTKTEELRTQRLKELIEVHLRVRL